MLQVEQHNSFSFTAILPNSEFAEWLCSRASNSGRTLYTIYDIFTHFNVWMFYIMRKKGDFSLYHISKTIEVWGNCLKGRCYGEKGLLPDSGHLKWTSEIYKRRLWIATRSLFMCICYTISLPELNLLQVHTWPYNAATDSLSSFKRSEAMHLEKCINLQLLRLQQPLRCIRAVHGQGRYGGGRTRLHTLLLVSLYFLPAFLIMWEVCNNLFEFCM